MHFCVVFGMEPRRSSPLAKASERNPPGIHHYDTFYDAACIDQTTNRRKRRVRDVRDHASSKSLQFCLFSCADRDFECIPPKNMAHSCQSLELNRAWSTQLMLLRAIVSQTLNMPEHDVCIGQPGGKFRAGSPRQDQIPARKARATCGSFQQSGVLIQNRIHINYM